MVKSGWLRPTYSLAMRISAAVPPAIADPYVAIGFRPLSHIRPDVAALPDGIGVHRSPDRSRGRGVLSAASSAAFQ